MTGSTLGRTSVVLLCFGFLALMAWTGGLADVHATKARALAWLVEDVVVGTLGRGPGAVVTACAGIVLAVMLNAGPARSRAPGSQAPQRRESAPSVDAEDGRQVRPVGFGRRDSAPGGHRDTRSSSRAVAGLRRSEPDSRAGGVNWLPDPLDVTDASHVALIKAQRDPALWHLAAMAALAYRGDPHHLLPWLMIQPETDRATAGWIFLWAEGSRYLRGVTDFDFNSGVRNVADLLRATCERSETIGFAHDRLGLDPDFEAERLKCLAVIDNGDVAAGITVPTALLARPFAPPRPDDRFTLDDGMIVRDACA